MQQILKIRRSTLAQIFGIFYLLSITSWDLKVTHAHPAFFSRFIIISLLPHQAINL